jgi:hypothetical protein
VSAKGKAEGGRQENGKCPPQTEKQKDLSQRVSERNHKERAAAKSQTGSELPLRSTIRNSVDQRMENSYENRRFTCQWYAESGMIAEHVGEVSRKRRG